MRLQTILGVISLCLTLPIEATSDEPDTLVDGLEDILDEEDTLEQITVNDVSTLESEDPSAPECSSYRFLNETDRAMSYNKRSPLVCDRGLSGWYRFGGKAGNQMPESCVPKLRCGTHAPGWLNGSHPSVAVGAVRRKVCFHWGNGCCQWSTYIEVRNCSGFYVYKLHRPPACTLRYCGNGAGPSPASTTPRPTAPATTFPTPTSFSECSNYKTLREPDRAQGYKGVVKCDRSLIKGWYRFQGGAGQQMPDKCVPKQQCGTHAPGWLNGSHPSVADGAVQRKVCFHWSSGCCQWSQDIRVRNCGGFYVYELPPTRYCSLRYCGDRQQALTTSRPTPTPTPTSSSVYTRLDPICLLHASGKQETACCLMIY